MLTTLISDVSRISRQVSRCRHGFTLIELLVVVAVIVVLIAILLPSLASARAYSKQAACLSNGRQLGIALFMHAQEHLNYVQISGYIDSPGGATPEGLADAGMLKYSYYRDGNQWRPLPLSGAVAPYLGQQIRTDNSTNMSADINMGTVYKTFACPADTDRKRGVTAKAPGWSTPKSWGSYGVNEAFMGWRDEGHGVTGYSEARGLLSQLTNPAETMLVSDCVPRNGDGGWLVYCATVKPGTLGQAFYNNNGAGDKASFPINRHLGRMSILFADGHGEMQNMPRIDSVYSPNGPLNRVYLVAP